MTKGEKYGADIISGKANHGKMILRLCKYHAAELKKKNSGFVFDKDEAAKFVEFIELLRLTKGEWAGRNFILEGWQAFLIELIFGWKTSDGLRRFTEVTINVPKKNGKTELAAAISLACGILDKEYGGQIYMAATARDQAALCFKTAKDMVNLTPEIDKSIFEPLAHAIYIPRWNATIKALSSEASTAEGMGASVVIFDEYHLQKTNELRDNLRSGMAARRQPLFISISTAGTDKSVPYFKHLEHCRRIINGQVKADRHLVVMYVADKPKEWESESTWQQANPNYGISVKKDFLKQQYEEAYNEPAKQPNFITKHLNMWADVAETWIDFKQWERLGVEQTIEQYSGQVAWLGLDLGQTGDFAALAILIKQEKRMVLLMRFYICEQMAGKRTRADMLNFLEWGRQGKLIITEGNTTDYTVIEADIKKIATQLNIKSVAYDAAYASMLVNNLVVAGIPVHPYSQAITKVAAPTKQFYEWIMDNTLQHDANPVMAWMVSNVVMYYDDANGNYKVHKGRSRNKIDGVSATINAIGDYMIDMAGNVDNVMWCV